MELNRQRTVFGLALPPRSAGRKSRARPARHGAGSPSPATTRTHPRHLPAAPPDSRSLLSQPRARRSIAVLTGACGQSPGRGGVRQHPRHRSRSHTRDRRADGALPEQRATVHPRSSAATGTRTPTPPPCLFTFAETPLSWKTLRPWQSSPRPKGSGVRSSACDWNDRNGLKPSPERTENLTYKESFGIGVKLPQRFL